ncbi:sigma 54-interacting transcriptional regulator [Acidaminococcus sp. LBK-2]|uniref:sigma 54-interacting transcriptional regulator n=1 Tax=Acidaminococcus sp. LBK-2 TaxID=3456956 RepID=UPI003FA45401
MVKKIITDEIQKGAKVVVTFDYLANLLSESFSIPFTLVRRSPAAIIKIIMNALQTFDKIALIYHKKDNKETFFTRSMKEAASVFNYKNIATFEFHEYSDVMSTLENIKQTGYKAIIGPHKLKELAKKAGFSYYTVPLAEPDLLDAIEQAKQQLRIYNQHIQNETQMNTIINLSDQGIIALDSKGCIQTINHSARRIFSFFSQDPIGKPYETTPLANIKVIKKIQRNPVVQKDIIKVEDDSILCTLTPLFVGKTLNNIIISCELADQIQKKDIKMRSRLLSNKCQASKTFHSIIGHGDKISRAVAIARKYACYDSTVLISGQSGCGKEIFAQSIHNASNRKDKPFVVINCAALPESILESLLFGYEAGTFTGAKASGKAGLFELAHGGTVFLDEISEMPLMMQSRFLRVLQEHEVMRIGSDQPIPIDIRVIAATNRNLWKMTQDKTFREDLYYRINVLLLELPPLDQRKEDIEELSRYFLNERSSQLHIPLPVLTNDAIDFLKTQSYHGNIRQLNNILERAMILASSPRIDANLLRSIFDRNNESRCCFPLQNRATISPLLESTSRSESNAIKVALEMFSGNRQQAAAHLGISVSTLWRKMQKYKLYHKH